MATDSAKEQTPNSQSIYDKATKMSHKLMVSDRRSWVMPCEQNFITIVNLQLYYRTLDVTVLLLEMALLSADSGVAGFFLELVAIHAIWKLHTFTMFASFLNQATSPV